MNWVKFSDEIECKNQPTELLYKNSEQAIYAFLNESSCPYGASGKLPVIITPTANKTYSQLFEEVWSFAANDLGLAERILIVGYSFPELDAYAMLHLKDILKKKKNVLRYVCKDADGERIKEILGLTDKAIIDREWQVDHFRDWLA